MEFLHVVEEGVVFAVACLLLGVDHKEFVMVLEGGHPLERPRGVAALTHSEALTAAPSDLFIGGQLGMRLVAL